MDRMEQINEDDWDPRNNRKNRNNRKKRRAKGRGRARRTVSAEWDDASSAVPRREDLADAPLMKRSHAHATIDYIPVELFALFSFASAGIYPYFWLLDRVDTFAAVDAIRLDRTGIDRYCVIGIFVQLLPLAAAAVFLWARFTGLREWYAYASILLAAYAAALVFVVLPLRCFYQFDICWRMRRAVSMWDKDGMMIERTAPSLFRLFLFGTAYIQRHVNRLIGLGMPGFAGYDEIGTEATLGDAIKEYVKVTMRRE
jgi:hypothetical protein